MSMNTKMGWTAFLVTLATLCATSAEATVTTAEVPTHTPVVEGRIARINAALKTQAQNADLSGSIARGWANGGGGRGFVNTRGGGWGNGAGSRGFVNVNPWRNGWADGGGFWNSPWRNGGGFVNW